jgi:hypothetical protein
MEARIEAAMEAADRINGRQTATPRRAEVLQRLHFGDGCRFA